MIRALSKKAQAEGVTRIDWIVATENDNARQFYARIGARLSEEVRHCRLDEAAIKQLPSVIINS